MTTAVDIKNALSNIKRLQSIGNCPTLIQDYKEVHDHMYRDEDEDEEEDEESEGSEAQKDIKSKGHPKTNDVRISRCQKLSSSTLKHSCRRRSRRFVISSMVSQLLHQLGLSTRRSISELLVRAVNLTARSADVTTLF